MQRIIPALRITNYEQSKRFYVEALGFQVDWEARFEPGFPVFMQISRDGIKLFLTEHRGDCQPGGLVHFYYDDLDPMYEQIWATRRVPHLWMALSDLDGPPEEKFAGLRMFYVRDLDGNKVAFCTILNGTA
jgi:catechol 2,3-dioxygenase-like lactoylglutathione lyase family enzyme